MQYVTESENCTVFPRNYCIRKMSKDIKWGYGANKYSIAANTMHEKKKKYKEIGYGSDKMISTLPRNY